MTLNPVCENVETAQGVPLTVTGVAQVISGTLKKNLQMGFSAAASRLTLLGASHCNADSSSLQQKLDVCFVPGQNHEESRITSHCL